MVFNFKKIVSVIASVAMVGSTLGFAAAANFPAPFVQNGNADVALIYGADSAQSDLVAIMDITSSLNSALITQHVGTSSTGPTTTGGESYKIERSTEKLNIGESLTDVKNTAITKDDLPNLLKKQTFRSADGKSYDYEQEITLASGLNYDMFKDNAYNNGEPTLGIFEARNTLILNYSINFVKSLESDVDSNGYLEDIKDSDIVILGKTYRIFQATNGTDIKLELTPGSLSASMRGKETKTFTFGGKTYEVTVNAVSSNSVYLTINGVGNSVSTSGTPKTFYFSDGSEIQVSIKSAFYADNPEDQLVEFSLGLDSMTIENGKKLKVGDDTIYDVYCYVTAGNSGTKRTIEKITFSWVTNDKLFITPTKEVTFPGLGSFKIAMANLTTATPEIISLRNSGDKTMQITLPVKSGEVTIPLVSLDSTKTNITKIGGDSSGSYLVTGSNNILFNLSTDQYFVASKSLSTAAESYVLTIPSSIEVDSDTGINRTTVKDVVSGQEVCSSKKTGDVCDIGNVQLTFTKVDSETVNITGSSGTVFNVLYTAKGFKINLPVSTGDNGVNATNDDSFLLVMQEADKNNNIAGGKQINATIGVSSNKIEVSSLSEYNDYSGGSLFDLPSDSDKHVGYMKGDLGTKIFYDESGNQNTLQLEYYGGDETRGNVFIASTEATITSGTTGSSGTTGGSTSIGNPIFKDTEVSSVSDKNWIVVGGSCVNSVAASLIEAQYKTCGSGFTAKTGIASGEAIIKTLSRSNSSKIATLVAGYNAQDTLMAAKYLTTQTVDTTAGNGYRVTSQTTAVPLVSTA